MKREFSSNGVLHIGVQALVGIKLRRIAGQIEDLDAIHPLGEPSFHRLVPAWALSFGGEKQHGMQAKLYKGFRV